MQNLGFAVGESEVVEHTVNGLLVDPRNIQDLEQAIRAFITDPQRREDLIRKGYDTVQNHFSQENIFSNIEREIRQTIQNVRR